MKESNYKILAWTILGIAFSFMICIFAPLDAFFANMDEYWFSISQLLSVCIVAFIIFVILFILFAFLFKKIKINHILYAFVLTCFVFLYIQGNYMPRNYGVLNGSEILWDEYKLYATLSIVLFVACLIFLFVLLKLFKKSIYTIGLGLSLFVLLIQLVTSGVLFVQNINNLEKDPRILTDKNLFGFSKDRNIIVFLLDSYDGSLLNEVLEEDKEHQESVFENFTYYSDTLGCYPTTKASLPMILTGEWYENQMPYEEYVAKAYENNSIYKAFKENNYQLDVYTYLSFLNANEVDYNNVEIGEYIISNKIGFAKKVFKLVGFNYMPHQFKKYFLYDNEEFSKYRKTNLQYSSHSFSTMDFLDKYNNQGVLVNKDNNIFKFYHLDGTHAPATFGIELKEDGKKYIMKDEAYGNSELLKLFFDDFKKKGIYDSSTIIILADHGSRGYWQNPIFLIKNQNESHPFEISNEKLSYVNLKEIWIKLANGEQVDQSFIKSLNNDNETRRYLYYTWEEKGWEKEYMPGMQEMYFYGAATDYDNAILTGKTFLTDKVKHDYRFGDVLEFDGEKTVFNNVLLGVNKNTLLNKSLFAFDFNQPFKNILVEIELEDSNATRHFNIKANGNDVAELSLGGTIGYKSFIIPGEYIDNNCLELSIERVKEESGDFNDLGSSGVKIKTIKLESTEDSVNVLDQIETYKYKLGTLLDFSLDGNTGYEYVINGFSGSEKEGTWTEGNNAKLKFNIDKTNIDLYLELSYSIFNKEQHVQIYCNNTIIADYIAQNDDINKTFVIPSELVDSNTLYIEFVLPDAVSPKSLNINSDDRELAIRLYKLNIHE